MNSQLERVMKRLCYEGYMHSTEFSPAKTQFSLRDIIAAGVLEPRLYELLPGLVKFDSMVIRNIKRDLSLNPRIKRQLQLVDQPLREGNFFGVPFEDCIKQMRIIEKISKQKYALNKTRSLNIRLSEQDISRLAQLSQIYKKTKSDVIRDLLTMRAYQSQP